MRNAAHTPAFHRKLSQVQKVQCTTIHQERPLFDGLFVRKRDTDSSAPVVKVQYYTDPILPRIPSAVQSPLQSPPAEDTVQRHPPQGGTPLTEENTQQHQTPQEGTFPPAEGVVQENPPAILLGIPKLVEWSRTPLA